MTYKLDKAVCAMSFTFNVDERGHLYNCLLLGGCQGNSQALGELLEDMHINIAITKLEGIICANKGTSCGNEIALALKQYLYEHGPVN